MTNAQILKALREAHQSLNEAGDALIETQEHDSVALDNANNAVEYALIQIREAMDELIGETY